MTSADTWCTLAPYFTIHAGKLDEFKAMWPLFKKLVVAEEKCMFYTFSFAGQDAHCREGYTDADGVLAHLKNVGPQLQEALKISDLTRLEVHGPAAELAKLREPMAGLNPKFFTVEFGFRR